MEGVRLFQAETFFDRVRGPKKHLEVFEKGVRNDHKQETHTLDSCKIVELDLKDCLLGLTKELFGQGKMFRSSLLSSKSEQPFHISIYTRCFCPLRGHPLICRT